MNEITCTKSPTESYWSQLFLMAILASGIFVSIEYVPTILNGAVGIIVGLIAAGVFLYSVGRVAGQMIADNSTSNPTPKN